MARLGGKLRLGVAIAIIAATAACSSIYRNHGYVPAQEVLDEIVVGLDTRDSVAETAGPPSAMGVTDAGGFYYVRSRTRTLGFRAPEVVEREVLAVSFDNRGVVRNIERFGLEDGRVVTLQRRVTETGVVDRVLVRQLLRNLGRIGSGSSQL